MIVDRTLTGLVASARAISPNGDGVDDRLTLSFTLTQNAPVRIDVEQSGAVVATLFQGQPGLGQHTVDWDGTTNGAPLADGRYDVVVTVTDALGDVQLPLPLTIDTTPPVLTLLDAATAPLLAQRAGDGHGARQPADARSCRSRRRARSRCRSRAGSSQISAEAQDAAGNLSTVVTG